MKVYLSWPFVLWTWSNQNPFLPYTIYKSSYKRLKEDIVHIEAVYNGRREENAIWWKKKEKKNPPPLKTKQWYLILYIIID